MITLTTAEQINSVIGGNVPIGYNKLVLSPYTIDPVTQSITGTLRLSSSTNTEMQPITGRFQITTSNNTVLIEFDQLKLSRKITLTTGQNNSVKTNIIDASQNSLESGFITIGAVAGTQSAGV